MSKKRGTQHQHRRRRGRVHAPDDWHGVMYGVCAGDDDLPELRSQLHDALIAQLGAWRRGGVTWHMIPHGGGKGAAIATLERLIITERLVQPSEVGPTDASPETMIAYLEQLAARLADWPDGYLVIARAPAIRPDLRR